MSTAFAGTGTPFTHCITDPAEEAGLRVGRIITPSDQDVHGSVSSSAKRCCSKELKAVSYVAGSPCKSNWEIRCL